LKDELLDLERRKADIEDRLTQAPEPMPRFHPNLAEVYRQKVANLAESLNQESTRAEAAEAIRDLIDEIRLVPDGGKIGVELYGELSALMALGNNNPRPNEPGVQITLVAGARNHRELILQVSV
jgi:hypothetical protein